MPVKRRFIAGAICPECQLMDKLVMYQQEDQRIRECVQCGFSEVASRSFNSSQEITTRVNRQSTDTQDETIQRVRLIDPTQ